MTHPIIAREGWLFLAISLAASLLATWAWGKWSAPLWLWTLFVLQFFRDPARVPPADVDAVMSPADGRIVAVERTTDPYLERDALKISVFMNVFNVHSNRSPVDGEIKGRWYNPGAFLNAAVDKASTDNERNALWIRTERGDITFVQIAGLIARRILCYVRTGDVLGRGQRYGFIRFGSRVDVYLPLHAKPEVSLGQKVKAAKTILARW
ncbi:MAG TPA: phosphatidylserine decarboxylase [Thiobacillaceae bacterium]|nr:phosphatidylserine decarboxylase [Thiobacillaceae bacterium]